LATVIEDIRSRDWQLSTAGVGIIAEGLADIRQCLDVLLRTVKGSCPLRHEFGSDIRLYVDKPLTIAIPNIKRSIIEAVSIWEKRVVIKKISHEIIDISTVNFFVTYGLVDEELIDMLKIQLSDGFISIDDILVGSLILQALFPPNPNNKRYGLQFSVDGQIALPKAPTYGFATLNELYQWMLANLGGYGQWVMGSDRIVGYLPANQFLTASIAIVLIGTVKFETGIPDLSPGETFTVSGTLDGVSLNKSGLANLSDMLLWAQSNWPQYGNWQIEGFAGVGGDFVDSEFNSDFDLGTPATYKLVLYSGTVNTATLTVTAV
jgi:phage baseplate assembly protein W